MLFAVDDVRLGGPAVRRGEQHLLDDVLDALDGQVQGVPQGVDQGHHLERELAGILGSELSRSLAGLLDGADDFLAIENLNPPVTFPNSQNQIRLHVLAH